MCLACHRLTRSTSSALTGEAAAQLGGPGTPQAWEQVFFTPPHGCGSTRQVLRQACLHSQVEMLAHGRCVSSRVTVHCHVVALGHSGHANRHIVPPQAALGHGRGENSHACAPFSQPHNIPCHQTKPPVPSNGSCSRELWDKAGPRGNFKQSRLLAKHISFSPQTEGSVAENNIHRAH